MSARRSSEKPSSQARKDLVVLVEADRHRHDRLYRLGARRVAFEALHGERHFQLAYADLVQCDVPFVRQSLNILHLLGGFCAHKSVCSGYSMFRNARDATFYGAVPARNATAGILKVKFQISKGGKGA